ncbi:MAG: hypothetical protein HQK55_09185, partial [Deltaproteobacteria bacterium]|nr:hypothetical protein [Deltaproteobacteria bacterium]
MFGHGSVVHHFLSAPGEFLAENFLFRRYVGDIRAYQPQPGAFNHQVRFSQFDLGFSFGGRALFDLLSRENRFHGDFSFRRPTDRRHLRQRRRHPRLADLPAAFLHHQ